MAISLGRADQEVVIERLMSRWPTGFDSARAGTADLCDLFHHSVDTVSETNIAIMAPIFRDFGGITRFQGRATTVRCAEGNPGVRAALNEDGAGRVLVVDAGANMRCAIIGDLLSELAEKRGWAGMIINGCVRDTDEIKQFAVGIKALAPHPLKPGKRDGGLRDVPVVVGGTIVCPGDYIYADSDGVLVSKGELRVPDNAPKGKIPLTIPGAAKGSSSAAASALKASSRSSLLSKLTEGAAVPAAPAVPAVPAAAEEPVPRPASFSGLEGLAGSTHDDDRI